MCRFLYTKIYKNYLLSKIRAQRPILLHYNIFKLKIQVVKRYLLYIYNSVPQTAVLRFDLLYIDAVLMIRSTYGRPLPQGNKNLRNAAECDKKCAESRGKINIKKL